MCLKKQNHERKVWKAFHFDLVAFQERAKVDAGVQAGIPRSSFNPLLESFIIITSSIIMSHVCSAPELTCTFQRRAEIVSVCFTMLSRGWYVREHQEIFARL